MLEGVPGSRLAREDVRRGVDGMDGDGRSVGRKEVGAVLEV